MSENKPPVEDYAFMSDAKYRRRRKAIANGFKIRQELKECRKAVQNARLLMDNEYGVLWLNGGTTGRALSLTGAEETDQFTERVSNLRERMAQLEAAITKLAEKRAEWLGLSAWERNYLIKLDEFGTTVANGALNAGSSYTGTTNWQFKWVENHTEVAAVTKVKVSKSARNKSPWGCNDAVHVVQLDPEGLILLEDCPDIARQSMEDGLRMLALYPGGRAVWSPRHASKSLATGRGYIGAAVINAREGQRLVVYHGTASATHAKAGAQYRASYHWTSETARQEALKDRRRVSLVTRLCKDAKATLADAKEMGYCDPGIEEFQRQFGIGDEATLTELMDTKNPAAVALAMRVARKLSAKRREERQTSKEESCPI